MRQRHYRIHSLGSSMALNQPLRSLLLLASLGLLFGSQAFATTFVRVSDQDLADSAAVIVEVEVLGVESASSGGFPATEVSLLVQRVIKGDATLGHLTVRLPGGRDAVSGMELQLFGSPELRRGGRALLFLAPSSDSAGGAHRVLHLFQGFFQVSTTLDGKSVAYRDFSDAKEILISGRKGLAPEGPRDLERFSDWLQARVAGEHRPADYASTASFQELVASHQKFTLLNRGGFPTRWPDFDSGSNVPFRSFNGSQPGLPSGGHSEFQQAINVWVNNGGSNVRYVYAGRTSDNGGLSNFDGTNAIIWDDPDGVFDTPFNCGTGGTIAGAGPWTSSDPAQGRHVFNGRTFTTIFGADVVTNKGISCWINQNRRAQEVFGHELGHTLGLGHSCTLDNSSCLNGTLNQALMRAQAHGDGRGAALNSDDRAGISTLYPGNVQPPSAPSNLSAVANSGGEVVLTWSDNSGNESSFVIERRTGNGSFSEVGSTSANIRTFTDSSVASGTDYGYRVLARNSSGDSGDSNIATITTSGEAAPSNFTAQVLSATSVRLTWTDNALAETGFEVDADGFGAYFPSARPGANFTSTTVTGLNPNTQYTFRIRSIGSPAGSSSFAESAPVTLLNGTPEPCVSANDTQCLRNDRFKVQVAWRNFEDDTGTASVVDVDSPSSGLFWFFQSDNWEMLVKVLDGCVLTDHFWVFASATTNLEYRLLVLDTETGQGVVYENPLGTPSSAITDTGALPCSGNLSGAGSEPSAPTIRHRLTTDLMSENLTLPEISTASALIPGAAKADCTAGDSSLCLSGGRFQVEVDWSDFSNNDGQGTVVGLPVTADDSGLFWFFQSDNWEMLVKVLDGCGVNNNFWVFSAATTTVEYTLKVTDTETGEIRQYTNPLGSASPAVTDIEAFATCQ